MKKLKLFFACLLMAVLSIGQVWGQAAAGTTLFSENFGSYSANNVPSGSVTTATGRVVYGDANVTYTCADNGSNKTMIYAANLAGGTSPELLVGKSAGVFTIADIPSGGAQEITVSFKQNAQKLTVSVSGDGYSTDYASPKPSAAGTVSFDITVADGAANTFTLSMAAGSSNVRVDDILLTVKTAGEGGGSDPVAVTGVTLNKSELELEVDASETLTATVAPGDATDKSVSWSSDDESVATVANGVVTAVAEGTATITVTTTDGSFTDECEVTVIAAAPAVEYVKFTGDIEEGDYVIYYDGKAMKNTVASNRLSYESVTPTNNKVKNPSAAIVWHIAPAATEGYWTMFNEEVSKYAVCTGSNNQANLNASADNAIVSVVEVSEGNYNILSKVRQDAGSNNYYLRNNGTYGFAFYGSGTGGALTLYKNNSAAPAVAKPTISGTDNFLTSTEVTMECSTDGAAIYYTTTESAKTTPATSGDWAAYNSASKPSFSATTTVWAAAKKGDDWSAVAEKTFTKATVMTVAQALAASAGANQYVKGIIYAIDEVSTEHGNATYYLKDEGQENSIKIYRGKYLDNANFTAVDQIIVGDEVTVTGTISVYSEVNQFAQGNYIVAMKPAARLAWSEDSYEADLSGSNTFPNLTNTNAVTVAYSSSNTDAATINAETGAISLVAVGSTTITASFTGNETYRANSVSYTLNVSNSVLRADISFEENGGSEVADLTNQSNLPDPLPTITKAGKNFGGWFTTETFEAGSEAVAGAAVESTDAITLYAKWLDPYSVTEALSIINALADGAQTESSLYVAGIVSTAPTAAPSSGKLTFYISVNGEAENELQAYNCKDLGNVGFDSQDDIQVGDEVTIFGPLKKFIKNEQVIPEFNTGYLYTFNRPEVAVESVSLPATETVEVGSTVTLTATVLPANATNKSITWTVESGSDKASVADGVVSGLEEGEAVIRATSVADGTKYAECTVTVNAAAEPTPTVTFNYEDYKDEGTGSSGSEYTMVKTGIVSIGDTKFYGNNNYAHFYAGGETTITPAAGVTITQIVLTASATNYNGYQSSGVVTASAGSLSHEGVVVTWTGPADAAFTISHDKQIRWTTIVVTYEAPDPSAPALAVAPNVIDFGDVEQGSSVSAQTVAVNFANLTGAVTYSGLSSPFSATGTISTTGNEITISADASAAVDEYEQTLTVTSVADSKSATVTVKMNIVAAASGDVYEKLTGSIEEGDYVIFYDGKALKNTVASSRFGYEEVTPVNNKISNPDPSIVWSISQSEEYWTIYNETVSKYAGATGSNNQGALLDATGDKALWSISGTGEFDITNKYQADNSKNAYLRNNGTYGFACYAIGTGGKLILYKAVNSKASAGLTWSEDVEIVIDGEFTAPTLDYAAGITGTIAYESDNESVATVSDAGVISLTEPHATGTAHITATYGGDENFKPGSAVCTIKVNPANSIYVDKLNVNFGSVEKDAAIEDKTIVVTLTNVANATATLAGDGASAFEFTPAALTESGSITISASSATAGTFNATLTISDDAGLAASKVVSLKLVVNDPAAAETPISTSSKWVAATAADLVDGAEVIITGVKDEVVYAMGEQKSTNRAGYVASVDGEGVLTPGEGTMSFTLVAQETEGVFALRTSDGKYLYAAASGSNHLKTQDNVDVNAQWTLSITSAVATGSSNRNVMQFNGSGTNKLFACYASDNQEDIQFYVPKPVTPEPPVVDYTEVRNGLTEGWYYTMCLDKAVTAVKGGSIWRVLSKAANGNDVILEEAELPLVAGRPYIFRAAAITLEVAYTGDAVLAPVTEGNNGLIGSFEQAQITNDPKYYIIHENALYYVNSDNVYVGAHRAYLDMTDVPAYDNNEPQQGNAPRRRVTMAVHGEQTATGFENINASEKPMKLMIDGNIYILRGEKMYDATGRLVK